MDILDVKIVSRLQDDATSTNSAIARTVEVSEETVRRRLKRLMTDEMIKIVAIPDARKLGYESQVLIGIQVDADKIDGVADALAGMSEITWISVTTGSYDIFAWATLKSIEALSKFLRDGVGQIAGVRKMETFISLSVGKGRVRPEHGIGRGVAATDDRSRQADWRRARTSAERRRDLFAPQANSTRAASLAPLIPTSRNTSTYH